MAREHAGHIKVCDRDHVKAVDQMGRELVQGIRAYSPSVHEVARSSAAFYPYCENEPHESLGVLVCWAEAPPELSPPPFGGCIAGISGEAGRGRWRRPLVRQFSRP